MQSSLLDDASPRSPQEREVMGHIVDRVLVSERELNAVRSGYVPKDALLHIQENTIKKTVDPVAKKEAVRKRKAAYQAERDRIENQEYKIVPPSPRLESPRHVSLDTTSRDLFGEGSFTVMQEHCRRGGLLYPHRGLKGGLLPENSISHEIWAEEEVKRNSGPGRLDVVARKEQKGPAIGRRRLCLAHFSKGDQCYGIRPKDNRHVWNAFDTHEAVRVLDTVGSRRTVFAGASYRPATITQELAERSLGGGPGMYEPKKSSFAKFAEKKKTRFRTLPRNSWLSECKSWDGRLNEEFRVHARSSRKTKHNYINSMNRDDQLYGPSPRDSPQNTCTSLHSMSNTSIISAGNRSSKPASRERGIAAASSGGPNTSFVSTQKSNSSVKTWTNTRTPQTTVGPAGSGASSRVTFHTVASAPSSIRKAQSIFD